ncbi:hypothetical protein QY049_18785 [Bradyrhizobium sp. WYCCWR 13022]|nr:hypothetical protein [Bradyrhizobium sp. WYCCWR 13022]MDN4985256.1 hypothetical protein [Bradyrhizobium sp. WYCCWR 13022]
MVDVAKACDVADRKSGGPPNNRATLHEKQPVYWQWLGDLFGVEKKA